MAKALITRKGAYERQIVSCRSKSCGGSVDVAACKVSEGRTRVGPGACRGFTRPIQRVLPL